MWTGTATVTLATYPAATAPNLDGSIYIGAGQWNIANPSTTRTLIVSEDGVNDAFSVPPATNYATPSSTVNAKLWVRLDAGGSVVVTGNLTSRNALEF
jgi:hypothetical protein